MENSWRVRGGEANGKKPPETWFDLIGVNIYI